MKKLVLLLSVLIASMMCWAGGAYDHWEDAKKVDLTKPSPEATMVKALMALNSSDKAAYTALLTESYQKTVDSHYRVGAKKMTRRDMDNEFRYEIQPFDGGCWVQYKIITKDGSRYSGGKFKVIMVDGKYLIAGI